MLNNHILGYLKSKYFIIIALFSIFLICSVLYLHTKEVAQVKQIYVAKTDIKSVSIADTIYEKFKTAYETVRTVSLLPGVVAIELPGQVLAQDTIGSIQQLYNNAFLNIQLSEIYILPKGFDYQKINSVTQKPEEPLAVFDELITDNKLKSEKEKSKNQSTIVEDESFEYALYRDQFKFFNTNYPTNSTFKKLAVPMLSGPEIITCDNSDFTQKDVDSKNNKPRKGLVFTVPKYSQSGNMNGGVSAVLRTSVIEKYLPNGTHALVNRDYKNQIIKSPSASWLESVPFFNKGLINSKLIYSKIIKVKTNDLHSWELWVALPDSLFYETEIFKKVQTIFKIEIVAILFFIFFLIRTTYKNFIRNNAVNEISSSLVTSADKLNTSADELNNASQAIKQATEQQATSTRYIENVVEEMSEMTMKSSENIEVLLRISEKSFDSTTNSKLNVIELSDTLTQMELSEKKILQQVEENGDRLNDIMKFINEIKNKTKLIDDIVFQTKLLSFNASVEASRAGEHGKGFSIVAEEVGKLATISGVVSKDIKDMLSDGINKLGKLVNESSGEIKNLIDESSISLEKGALLSRSCITQLNTMASIAEEVQFKIITIQGVIKEQGLGLKDIKESSSFFQESIAANKNKSEKAFSIAEELILNSKDVRVAVTELSKITQN